MKEEKRYNKIRLGALKKLNNNYEKEKKNSQGYEQYFDAAMPIMSGRHKFDPWVIWLGEKIKIRNI